MEGSGEQRPSAAQALSAAARTVALAYNEAMVRGLRFHLGSPGATEAGFDTAQLTRLLEGVDPDAACPDIELASWLRRIGGVGAVSQAAREAGDVLEARRAASRAQRRPLAVQVVRDMVRFRSPAPALRGTQTTRP